MFVLLAVPIILNRIPNTSSRRTFCLVPRRPKFTAQNKGGNLFGVFVTCRAAYLSKRAALCALCKKKKQKKTRGVNEPHMIHTGTAEHSCTICLGLSMTAITWPDGQDNSPDPCVLRVRLVIRDGRSVICKIKEDFTLPLFPAAGLLLLHPCVSLPSPQVSPAISSPSPGCPSVSQ